MRERAFSVVTAYTKTEPVQVALFGLLLLGDHAHAGHGAGDRGRDRGRAAHVGEARHEPDGIRPEAGSLRPRVGSLLCPRGDWVSRRDPVPRRGLLRDAGHHDPGLGPGPADRASSWSGSASSTGRRSWRAFAAWRPSLGAGFLGALASQFWFIGFALTTAANVRTLALVEVVMAQVVSHRFLAQATTRRELAGMVLILGGVALLLLAQR